MSSLRRQRGVDTTPDKPNTTDIALSSTPTQIPEARAARVVMKQ
jgi:hypothetical protein